VSKDMSRIPLLILKYLGKS